MTSAGLNLCICTARGKKFQNRNIVFSLCKPYKTYLNFDLKSETFASEFQAEDIFPQLLDCVILGLSEHWYFRYNKY